MTSDPCRSTGKTGQFGEDVKRKRRKCSVGGRVSGLERRLLAHLGKLAVARPAVMSDMAEAPRRGEVAWAGWPWVVAHPGLPQTRTCAIDAYGSSNHGFAGRRYTEWTTTAAGSGYRSNSRLKCTHGMVPSRRRRDSHLCQTRTTPRRNRHSAEALLVIP